MSCAPTSSASKSSTARKPSPVASGRAAHPPLAPLAVPSPPALGCRGGACPAWSTLAEEPWGFGAGRWRIPQGRASGRTGAGGRKQKYGWGLRRTVQGEHTTGKEGGSGAPMEGWGRGDRSEQQNTEVAQGCRSEIGAGGVEMCGD
eukprot:scaffold28663_cov56-Isochrysis_galbana.AAC.1